MAELIDVLFGGMIWVAPRNRVLDEVQIPQGEWAIFGGCPALSKALCVTDALYCAKKINNGSTVPLLQRNAILPTDRRHIALPTSPVKKIRPCDAAFRRNSLTTC